MLALFSAWNTEKKQMNTALKKSHCAYSFIFFPQKYPEHAIYKVLHLMLRRGELQHRMQRKVLYRVK